MSTAELKIELERLQKELERAQSELRKIKNAMPSSYHDCSKTNTSIAKIISR